MEILKSSFGDNSLEKYIQMIEKYKQSLKEKSLGNEVWGVIRNSQIELIDFKIKTLESMRPMHEVFIKESKGGDAKLSLLINDVYDGLVSILIGKERISLGMDSLFINKEIQSRLIDFWKTFHFDNELDVVELRGKPFIEYWENKDDSTMNFNESQLFLIRHISPFMYSILNYEELKKSNVGMSEKEYAHYLLPIFFLPVGCFNFNQRDDNCDCKLIALDYKNKKVVNI